MLIFNRLSNVFIYMSQEKDRLISLIAFAEESAKLKLRPSYHVKKHPFCRFEHELRGLPGIHFNTGGEQSETWLVIDRLHETNPPLPNDPQFAQWLETSKNPNKKPELRPSIERQRPEIDSQAGIQYPASSTEPELILLKNTQERGELESQYQAYIVSQWTPLGD